MSETWSTYEQGSKWIAVLLFEQDALMGVFLLFVLFFSQFYSI